MKKSEFVAILILVDFPLQQDMEKFERSCNICRNPYFSGFSLAINKISILDERNIKSQSLFQWIFPCNIMTAIRLEMNIESRNPYFSGFSLAIKEKKQRNRGIKCRNPYFSGFSLAIQKIFTLYSRTKSRNPYFSGFSLAILKEQFGNVGTGCRNPYFSGFSLAILNLILKAII